LIDYPPFSPDLALGDSFLFPKLKERLCGQTFAGDDNLMSAANSWLEVHHNKFFLRGI
jgi:hypothetical protein